MRSRRLLIYGWADNVHIQRWAYGLAERGYTIRVVSLGGRPLDGIETVIFPRVMKADYFLKAPQAVRQIKSFQPDIVHSHYASGFGLWAAYSGFPRTVVSVWGSDVTVFGQKPLGKKLLRYIFDRVSRVTVTGEFLRGVTLSIDPTVQSKMETIPFGVEIPSSCPAPGTNARTTFCYLKAHRPIYGPDTLLTAFARASEQVPDMLLSMAGRGELTESLKAQAASLGISDKVRFVGQLDHKKVAAFLQEHDALVMPSRMEGFGVAALEAAAQCRPVIATRIGGIPEVVDDEKTGLLVPVDDTDRLAAAMVRLARDPQIRAQMGQAGYELVRQKFTWEHSLDKMISLYDRLVHGG